VRQTGLTIDEGTARVRQAGATVDEVNQALSLVNKELDRVDVIAAQVQTITTNVSSLTSLFAATVGGPVVRVAAFSYGVRRAAVKRARADVASRVTAEMKAEKAARRAARHTSPTSGKGQPSQHREPGQRSVGELAAGAEQQAGGAR
jgi:hypothetical protein